MRWFQHIVLFFLVTTATLAANAQCSICTKTAQQLGDGPAAGLNTGIIYLGLVPLLIIGYIGFRWWKNEQSSESSK